MATCYGWWGWGAVPIFPLIPLTFHSAPPNFLIPAHASFFFFPTNFVLARVHSAEHLSVEGKQSEDLIRGVRTGHVGGNVPEQ